MPPKRKLWTIITVLCAVAVAGSAALYFGWFEEQKPNVGSLNAQEMRKLIERLAKVYRKPITIGGEAVLYQPSEDDTVREEMLAKGLKAVPYLKEGLEHENPDIVAQCVVLLSKLPCKDGIETLFDLLQRDSLADSTAGDVHMALYSLTGVGRFRPPGGTSTSTEKVREIWQPWWDANKNKLVDTDTDRKSTRLNSSHYS